MTTEARAGLDELVASIGPLDAAAMGDTARRLDRLTKPPGSLGRLETVAIELAGIRGTPVTAIGRPAIVVFAGDHGVTAQAVSPYPSDVTRQMVANFAAGGAAINVLAQAAGADLVVVDVGVAGPPFEPLERPTDAAARTTVVHARVAAGTRDLSVEPAMTVHEVAAAIAVGRRVVDDLIDDGCDLIAVGEMGIGNTTASSAIVAALLGQPADRVTGRGTGLDNAGVRRKTAVVEMALARHSLGARRPIDVLAAVGGLEIAALVGAILAAAARHVPVVLDGFITGAAALVAAQLAPDLSARLIASHRSPEPGHRLVLEALGLEPVLDLGLRLGEGSGAALAIPIVVAAARILGEMATFDDAGVSNRS
ncbi:MAG TPA: nicotinate-nucleotide--dimethylbenzimidazole phosphoribosyltransferase [Candidatus Limnocylindrales bacterium]